MEAKSLVQPLRLGVVRFLNTQPIISGLEVCEDICLTEAVPSSLIDLLEMGEVDAALCSSIDYQQSTVPLVILPAPSLGCIGATQTVRLYSTMPFKTLDEVSCDSDSHTSVVLLQVLLREGYSRQVKVVPFDAAVENVEWPPAVMLIGDKVISGSPPPGHYPYQMDLGEAWHELTGLPFLFGIWLAGTDLDPVDARRIVSILDRQHRYNKLHSENLVGRESRARNWPQDTAEEYLSSGIRYEFGQLQREGLERFFELAAAHGLVEQCRPLCFSGA
jgi:chorismate dehydratase